MKENLCIKLDRTLIRMCRESRGRDAPRLARAALPLAALLRSCVLEIVVFGLGFHHDSFGLWRICFPPVLVRTGRRLPVQALGERGVLVAATGYPRNGAPGPSFVTRATRNQKRNPVLWFTDNCETRVERPNGIERRRLQFKNNHSERRGRGGGGGFIDKQRMNVGR